MKNFRGVLKVILIFSIAMLIPTANAATWMTPDRVMTQSSQDERTPARNSIDDNQSSYWSEYILTNVDGSTFDWYITYDMGETKQISSVRIYGDGNINKAPCKIGSIKVCDDADCDGEGNIVTGLCSFSTSLEWQECDVTISTGRYLEVQGGIYDSALPPACRDKTNSEMQGFLELDAEANNLPEIENMNVTPQTVDYGKDVQFMVNWSDEEAKELVKMLICKNNSVSGGGTPSCPGGEWCSNDEEWNDETPLYCNYTTTTEDIGQNGYWAFVCDDEGACSEEWQQTPFFTVQDNTEPYYSNQADDAGTSVEEGVIVNVSTYWQDAIDLDMIVFRTNSTGSWHDNATCKIGGETNESWCNKTINTTGIGGETICWAQTANDTAGNKNETMGELFECFDVNESCSIAIELSENLLNSIDWSVTTLPAENLASPSNMGTDQTKFWINVSASGCTADLYIKANGSLVSGVDSIGVGNETYCYNTTDDTVPGTACIPLDTSYSGNQIGSDLSGDTAVYLKFYLDVPSQQSAGSYINTISIKAVQSGESP